MSYGGYNQGGYGQSNPYDQRDGYGQQGGYGQSNPYGQSAGYSQNSYGQQDNYQSQGTYLNYGGGGAGGGTGAAGYAGYDQGQGYNNMEMQNLNGGSGGALGQDPSAILNECRDIDRAIDDLERQLQELQSLQRRFTTSNESSSDQINNMGSSIMDAYRALGQRVKRIKSLPESGNQRNAAQVGKVDRRLKKAINTYQTVESEFRRRVREQQERQYKIVRPEATEEEVRQACEEPNQQIFQQALMSSDRRGQAQSALGAVRARHDAIQNIEKTMIELAQLFQDLDAVVVQQDPAVQVIEDRAEEAHGNVVKANEEIAQANNKARSRRRKKWWCLLIVVLIVIILAVIGAVVGVVVGGNSDDDDDGGGDGGDNE